MIQDEFNEAYERALRLEKCADIWAADSKLYSGVRKAWRLVRASNLRNTSNSILTNLSNMVVDDVLKKTVDGPAGMVGFRQHPVIDRAFIES